MLPPAQAFPLAAHRLLRPAPSNLDGLVSRLQPSLAMRVKRRCLRGRPARGGRRHACPLLWGAAALRRLAVAAEWSGPGLGHRSLAAAVACAAQAHLPAAAGWLVPLRLLACLPSHIHLSQPFLLLRQALPSRRLLILKICLRLQLARVLGRPGRRASSQHAAALSRGARLALTQEGFPPLALRSSCCLLACWALCLPLVVPACGSRRSGCRRSASMAGQGRPPGGGLLVGVGACFVRRLGRPRAVLGGQLALLVLSALQRECPMVAEGGGKGNVSRQR